MEPNNEKPRMYGYEQDMPEDPTKCIEEVCIKADYFTNPGCFGHSIHRFDYYRQCINKRGYGSDGLYCKLHSKGIRESRI